MILSLNGCGSLFTGTSAMFTITSEPEKAKVYVNGLYIGTTPASTSLKKDKDYNIVVKKEGYEDASAIITRSFNAVAILNLLSPICWIVDIVTGGMWKFDREGVTVTLDPISKKTTHNSIIPSEGMSVKKLKNGKTAIYQN
jgi:hypothetical protein